MSQENHNRRKFLKLAGSGASGLVLAGCLGNNSSQTTSSGEGGEATTGESTTSEATTGESTTSEATTGESTKTSSGGTKGNNEFVDVFDQVVGTIDPAKAVDWTELVGKLNFYESLITVNTDRQVVKHIATKWTTEDDGKKWVFTLKDDISTHTGNTVTADDVVYSMKRTLAIQQGFSAFWSDVINDVTAQDDTTVTFELKRAFGPLVATFVMFSIVDSTAVKKNQKSGEYGDNGDYGQAFLKENTAGTGPYTLKSWESGNELVMQSFEKYWQGWEDGQFNVIRDKIVKETSTTELMMKKGNADMTGQYLSSDAYKKMSSYSNVTVPEVPQWQLFHLPLNTQKKPLDDENVRKAFVLAFDYDTAMKNIIKGGKQAAGPVPGTMPGHNNDLESYSQNVGKAKQALSDASYSVSDINDIGIEIVHIASNTTDRQMSLLLKQNLKAIGITNVKLNPQQWATITQRANSAEKTPHVTTVFVTAKYPSADTFTYQMFNPAAFGSYQTMSWYTTDQLKSTLKQARNATNADKRQQLYKQSQKMIVDGYPSIFIANPPYRVGLNKNVDDFDYYGVLSYERRYYYMTRKGDGRAK